MLDLSTLNRPRSIAAVFGLLACILTGCTTSHKIAATPVEGYPTGEKLDARVELRLAPDFRACRSDHGIGIHTYEAICGDALVEHATNMAKRMFKEVVVAPDADRVSATRVDAVLIPTVRSMSHWKSSRGPFLLRLVGIAYMFGFERYTMEVKIHWLVTDPAGEQIYEATIPGRVTTMRGLAPESRMTARIEQALAAAFVNACKKLSASKEVRRVAKDA